MFESRAELLEKLRHGEDGFLELKEVRFAGGGIRGPSQGDLADEIAAFANSCGGVLVLGVQDKSHEVVGIPIERLDDVEALVRQACEESINPPIAPGIERLELPDTAGAEQPVMRIDVPRGLCIHQSLGGYFHRVDSSKCPIPPHHLARLVQQRSQARLIRFDETPVPQVTLADLDEDAWRRFATLHSSDAPEHWLPKLAMAGRDESGALRPTVAGVLLACKTPERFLPGAFIQAVAYRGTEISPQTKDAYQRDAQDLVGTLDRQIFAACGFVARNMRVAARKNASGGREDIPQFDLLAVFEAMTNAVAHRDYSMAGSKVRLRLFDDRLELYTPGSLPNTMTPESLPHRQASRNEAITSLLARCPVEGDEFRRHRTHIMDKRGEGVPIILSRSEALSGKLPKYQLRDDSDLQLTIYAAFEG